MVAGAARIRVTFEVDADGLLAVTAMEEGSGVQAQVEVKPSYGLTDGEIEAMLKDSMSHAQEDLEARKLREEQVELAIYVVPVVGGEGKEEEELRFELTDSDKNFLRKAGIRF